MTALGRALQSSQKTFSFEVFPANTPEGRARLLDTVGKLCAMKPDFISCTYGAGGGNRAGTLDVVEHIRKTHGVESVAHLTCVAQTRADIESVLGEFERRGIRNVLALRGDPPKGADPASAAGEFAYASELVSLIRRRFPDACIGVAGFPEKHPLSKDFDTDARYLKAKVDAGADFVITQLFFDNRQYFDYVGRLKKIGVTCRVIPGILPITDYEGLKRFCERCGASVPKEVHEIFAPLSGDAEKTFEAGKQFAIRQCRALLEGGAPGIHLYSLNKTRPVDDILKAIRPA